MNKNKILIVDDSRTNIALLMDIFNEQYDILTAEDGHRALELIEEDDDTIDLILLDIVMPKMDGFEVCKILKGMEKKKNIPVILLSGLDSDESKVKGFELGAVDYVTKPFHEKEVIARVHTHIELYHLQRNLMNLVDKKTRELLEKEKILIHNAKMAELGEMVGMIAHQWRQPLNAISAAAINLDLRRKMNILKDEEIHDISKSIQMQAKNMSETINDFMDISKPETKKTYFSLQEVFAELAKLVGSQLQSRGISCEENINEGIRLYGHKREFIHAMLNLITNARDALAEEEIEDKKISIEARKTDENIVLCIRDNGKGIDPNILNKIFDPYFTTKEKGKGTGIGLYMVHEILKKNYDGTISAETPSEGGACFRISIPLQNEGAADTD